MQIEEFRKHPEYKLCMDKIKKYRKGFKFTIPYYKMTAGQRNGMSVVLYDAQKQGLISSVAVSYSLGLEITDETYIKL